MAVDCKCDRCKKYFDLNEVYCPDCISELDTDNNDLRNENERLQAEVDKLQSEIVDLKYKLDKGE